MRSSVYGLATIVPTTGCTTHLTHALRQLVLLCVCMTTNVVTVRCCDTAYIFRWQRTSWCAALSKSTSLWLCRSVNAALVCVIVVAFAVSWVYYAACAQSTLSAIFTFGPIAVRCAQLAFSTIESQQSVDHNQLNIWFRLRDARTKNIRCCRCRVDDFLSSIMSPFSVIDILHIGCRLRKLWHTYTHIHTLLIRLFVCVCGFYARCRFSCRNSHCGQVVAWVWSNMRPTCQVQLSYAGGRRRVMWHDMQARDVEHVLVISFISCFIISKHRTRFTKNFNCSQLEQHTVKQVTGSMNAWTGRLWINIIAWVVFLA